MGEFSSFVVGWIGHLGVVVVVVVVVVLLLTESVGAIGVAIAVMVGVVCTTSIVAGVTGDWRGCVGVGA